MSVLVPPGIVCTSEEYARSLSDPSIYCLTRGQSIGLTVTAESGLVSLVAVLGVFTFIIRNALRHVRHTGKWVLVEAPTDVLILSLFFSDLMQALGAVMDVHWVHAGRVEAGDFCSAQGVVQQLGETSVAITTLLMTLFTFAGVWWRVGLSATRLAAFLVALVWLFVGLLVVIGNVTHRGAGDLYESPTPYWCWIGQNYLGLRLAGEYVWFWLTLIVSAVAYLALFLWARGNITLSETRWWGCSFHRSHKKSKSTSKSKSSPNANANPAPHSASSTDAADRSARKNAYAMIAYPASYCLLILPLSVVRWIAFTHGSGASTPSAATFAVISLYGLSGAVNVALLLYTRPNSVLFGGGDTLHGYGNERGRGDEDERGRAPSLDDVSTYSEFRVREMGRRGGGGTQRSRETGSMELGRLPSVEEGGWDLPRKGVVHRHEEQEDDESTRTMNIEV